MGSELLLEVGCEEIPARFLAPALKQFEAKGKAALANGKIGHGKITTCGTPRRLVLAVHDVSKMQEGWEEKRLGPLVKQAFDDKGEPTKAALGFARSCGVSIDDLGREETKKGEKLSWVKKVEGRPGAEVLAELLPALIRSLEFPKSMRWGSGPMAFVRPIRWVVALLGGEVIGFDLGGISSGDHTRRHRFTHPEPIQVKDIDDYLDKLEKGNVIADPQKRRELIERDANKMALELGGELYPDPGLLDEVTNLVEYPVVLSGRFDDKYLSLPAPVPIAAMRNHQKYFAVRSTSPDKGLMPCFITVANTPAPDTSVIVRGNERVLGARLADAEFYWEEDKKAGLEKMREGTAGMLFYKTLGTYLDKTDRLSDLCDRLCDALFSDRAEIRETAIKAASFCKADLVSLMVGEFPELQGVMGGEYAKASGLGDGVADAIGDHYLPRSAEDIAGGVYPQSPAGDVVSIADKLDSVVSCWAAGLAPTGAGDPFSLRRQAQGVINLILVKGYRFSLPDLVEEAAKLICPRLDVDKDKVFNEVVEFILTRLRGQLIEAGHPYDAVDACLSAWNGDLLDTVHKIEAVSQMKKRDDFDPLMVAFRRVMNIIEGEPGPVDKDLFKEQSEADFFAEYNKVRDQAAPLLSDCEYGRALELMARLKPSVDRFFDDVLVNAEDEELKRNRHALCAAVAGFFKEIADFSKIVIEGEKSNEL